MKVVLIKAFHQDYLVILKILKEFFLATGNSWIMNKLIFLQHNKINWYFTMVRAIGCEKCVPQMYEFNYRYPLWIHYIQRLSHANKTEIYQSKYNYKHWATSIFFKCSYKPMWVRINTSLNFLNNQSLQIHYLFAVKMFSYVFFFLFSYIKMVW